MKLIARPRKSISSTTQNFLNIPEGKNHLGYLFKLKIPGPHPRHTESQSSGPVESWLAIWDGFKICPKKSLTFLPSKSRVNREHPRDCGHPFPMFPNPHPTPQIVSCNLCSTLHEFCQNKNLRNSYLKKSRVKKKKEK